MKTLSEMFQGPMLAYRVVDFKNVEVVPGTDTSLALRRLAEPRSIRVNWDILSAESGSCPT